MNNLDKQYQDLLRDILENGSKKGDRTGTGTISVFGRQIRHNMKEGFPLLTSKKMATKQIITELLWFLRGETNIQSLVEDGNYIWVGDAYKKFLTRATEIKEAYESGDLIGSQPHIESMFSSELTPLTRKEFIEKIKADDKFAYHWGDLGPVYGKQWRKWTRYEYSYGNIVCSNNIDQIAEMIDKLKNRPDDRRNMVTAWNPTEIEAATLPPCHYGFQVWTRELSIEERFDIWFNEHKPNRDVVDEFSYLHNEEARHTRLDESNIPRRAISLMWNQRSCDTPLGIPFNIASYGALLQILAGMVNMVPDELIGNLGDTHIYLNQVDAVKEQLKRDSHKLPQLNIARINDISDPSELKYEDFELLNYVSEDKIEFPLSN